MNAPPNAPTGPDPVVAMLVQALADSELLLGLFDPGDQLQWANRRYHELFLRGLALPVGFAQMLRHHFANGYGVQMDCGDPDAFLADILTRRRSKAFRVFAADLQDGTWIWMSETLLPNGWLLSSGTDITPLKHQESALRRLHEDTVQASLRDARTGAASQRHVLDTLRRALHDLADGGELSIALAALDQFVRFRDAVGRPAAEQALAAFVTHCQGHLRAGDMIGHLGGEEFLLLFTGMREALAGRVVQRLLATLPSAAFAASSDPLRFRAAVLEARPGEAVEELLHRADARLSTARGATGAPNGAVGSARG